MRYLKTSHLQPLQQGKGRQSHCSRYSEMKKGMCKNVAALELAFVQVSGVTDGDRRQSTLEKVHHIEIRSSQGAFEGSERHFVMLRMVKPSHVSCRKSASGRLSLHQRDLNAILSGHVKTWRGSKVRRTTSAEEQRSKQTASLIMVDADGVKALGEVGRRRCCTVHRVICAKFMQTLS